MLLHTETVCMGIMQTTSDISLQTAQPFSQRCDARQASGPAGRNFLLGVCSRCGSPGIACVQLSLCWAIRSPTIQCKAV